jgi:magnesium transporter
MLYVLLDGLIDYSSDLMLQIRRSVDFLEQDMMEEVSFGKQLLGYKRDLAHFEIVLEAKHRTMTALLSADTSLIDLDKIRDPLRDVVAHIEHSQRYVDRIEDRLSELHHHVTLLLQEKTNLRLRILTILSAIFMPLTFLAGVYGMNFRDMPELDWKYGYPFVLLVMLGIAIALLIYFVRKGWFR